MERSPPSISDLQAIQRALLAWHAEHALDAPWRDSRDPYQALVAAVMAQQTQMSRVMPSYERFIAAFPTLDALARATRGDVIRVWAGMGYNQRAVRLHNAAIAITRDGWPQDAAGLARIDGIGPFTAAIIASFAFGRAAACVDTNVRRVLGRLSGEDDIDGRRLQALADAALARREPARWNQALMDYGARVCTARPRCDECVVSTRCASRVRYATPALRVAEDRTNYVATSLRTKKPQPRFEDTARYARGRIIDALRALSRGESIAVGDLRASIAGGSVDEMQFADYIASLEQQGLLTDRRGRVSLPD